MNLSSAKRDSDVQHADQGRIARLSQGQSDLQLEYNNCRIYGCHRCFFEKAYKYLSSGNSIQFYL